MFRCDVCNIDCTGFEPLEQHKRGRNHKKMEEFRQRRVGCVNPAQERKQTVLSNTSLEQMRSQDNVFEFNGLSGFCYVCSVALTSPQVAEQHLNGKQHLKRAAFSSLTLKDVVTNAIGLPKSSSGEISSSTAYSALLNRRQNENLAEVDFSFKKVENLENKTAKSDSNNLLLYSNDNEDIRNLYLQQKSNFHEYCPICNVPVNTREQLEKHVRSPKHIKKEEQHKRGVVFISDRTSWYTCDVCGKQVNSEDQLKIHKKSHPSENVKKLFSEYSRSPSFGGKDMTSSGQGENDRPVQALTQSEGENMDKLTVRDFLKFKNEQTANFFNRAIDNGGDDLKKVTKEKEGYEPRIHNVDVESKHESMKLEELSYNNTGAKVLQQLGPLNLQSFRTPVKSSTEVHDRSTSLIYENNFVLNENKTKPSAVNIKLDTKSELDEAWLHPDVPMNTNLTRPKVIDDNLTPNSSVGSNDKVENAITSTKINSLGDDRKSSVNKDDIIHNIYKAIIPVKQNPNSIFSTNSNNKNDISVQSKVSVEKENSTYKEMSQIASVEHKKRSTIFIDDDDTPSVPISTDETKPKFLNIDHASNDAFSIDDIPENAMGNERIFNISSKTTTSNVNNTQHLLTSGTDIGICSDNIDTHYDLIDNISVAKSTVKKQDSDVTISALMQNISLEDKNVPNNLQNMPTKVPNVHHGGPFVDFRFYCSLCNVPFDTLETQLSHQNGKKHRAALAKTATVPERQLAPIKNDTDELQCLRVAFDLTDSVPRPYQIELFQKAMRGNTVIFLPTGTGKTLVSAMVIWYFLKLNPRRPVMFLVDRVLLVLQQQKVLKHEFATHTMERYDEDSGKLVDRSLRVAALCGGEQTLLDKVPLWQHDIVVATAAFYRNLLERGALRWQDNCLVVFDEAHHCFRDHPFNVLLRDWHLPLLPRERPMLLGLTASPAGKESVATTRRMLLQLLENMGGTRLIMVEQEANVLRRFQSNAQLSMKKIDLSPAEKRFASCLHIHLKTCLEHLSKEVAVAGQQLTIVSSCVDLLTSGLDEGLQPEIMDDVLKMLQDTWNNDANTNIVVQSLLMHIRELAYVFLEMRDVGLMAACHELELLLNGSFQGSFEQMATLDIHCDELVSIVQQQVDQSKSGNLTAADDEILKHILPVFECIMTEICEVNWSLSKGKTERPIVLVLVKTRKVAELLCRLAKNNVEIKARGLNVVKLVGHGTSSSESKGMSVRQQQKMLKEIKDQNAQIIFATSVAEEGLDLPNCELVIQLDPPTTVQALVQIRGRARKQNSKFLALFRDDNQLTAMKNLLMKELCMIEAVKDIVQQQNAERNHLFY